jgi:hypothetical protein
VNFLILAVAMFVLLVKLLGAVQKAAKPTKPDEPVIKECPYCLSMIPSKAVKCAHCTSDLPPEHEGGVDGRVGDGRCSGAGASMAIVPPAPM